MENRGRGKKNVLDPHPFFPHTATSQLRRLNMQLDIHAAFLKYCIMK